MPDGVAALLNSYVVCDLGLDLSFATDLWTTRRVRFKWRFKKLCVTNYQLPTATNNILISLCDNPPLSVEKQWGGDEARCQRVAWFIFGLALKTFRWFYFSLSFEIELTCTMSMRMDF